MSSCLDRAEASADVAQLRRLLHDNPRGWLILVACRAFGYTHREVGEALGISAGRVIQIKELCEWRLRRRMAHFDNQDRVRIMK